MTVIYKVDVVEGRLQLKGGGKKAAGGNVKLQAGLKGNVRWELASNASIDSFDITFEKTVFGGGSVNPTPAYPWPFAVDKINPEATQNGATGTISNCTLLEVEFDAPPASFKYTIAARTLAVLDPIIILE
jgi:hypothetical protein